MKVKQFKHRKSGPAHRASQSAKTLDSTTQLAESPQGDTPQSQLAPMEYSMRPISSKVMFWRPRYLTDSKWLQHVPFYFWLTEVLQPNLVVEPNINSAVGYFAICQAMDKLNQDGLAYAAFGAQCETEQVSRYNHEHYREFSQLSNAEESEFVDGFDDGCIDLLLLKQGSPLLLSEPEQAGLSPRLQRKLSAHAVVLIHGSMQSEYRKLCTSLRSIYPSFELTQQQGLLLLCVGKQIPPQLETLIHQGQDGRAQRLIQNIYARLGSANEDAWLCRVYEQQVHELTEQVQAQTHHLQHMQEATQIAAGQLQRAIQDADTAKAYQADLAAQLAALGDETANHCEQKRRLEQEKAQLEQALTALNQDQQQATTNLSRLQQDIDVRFDELAKLTQLLVETEARLDKAQQDNHTLRQQLNETQNELEQTKAASQQTLSKANTTLSQVKSELTSTQTELNRARHEQAQAQTEKIQAQTKAAQAQTALSAATTELAATQAELQKQCELTALLERDQQVAADKISTLAASELTLQQSLNERFDELAILTNLLQQKEQQHEATLGELQALQSQLNKPHPAVTDKIKNKFETAKQRRAKAKQLALDANLIRQSELFDEAWYLKQYPEAATHPQGAAGHYLEQGFVLGANPSAAFDGNWYLSTYQDVKDAGMNPLFHYLKFGHKESRLLKIF